MDTGRTRRWLRPRTAKLSWFLQQLAASLPACYVSLELLRLDGRMDVNVLDVSQIVCCYKGIKVTNRKRRIVADSDDDEGERDDWMVRRTKALNCSDDDDIDDESNEK